MNINKILNLRDAWKRGGEHNPPRLTAETKTYSPAYLGMFF